MPGDPIDPDWASDVTNAVNDLQGGALKIVAGQVTVTPGGSSVSNSIGTFFRGSATITFPAGTFSSSPAVLVTGNSGAPGTLISCSATGISATGATIWIARTDTTATFVYWIATAQT